jgi:hypothetical protein
MMSTLLYVPVSQSLDSCRQQQDAVRVVIPIFITSSQYGTGLDCPPCVLGWPLSVRYVTFCVVCLRLLRHIDFPYPSHVVFRR